MKFFNKNNMVKKIVLTTFVVAISVCLSLFLYWYKAYNDRVVPLDFNKSNHKGEKINTNDYGNNTDKSKKKHIDIKKVEGLTNILLLGTDGRTKGESTRSDTIMILTIDGNHNDIKLSSIERDTYCRAPGYWNQKITETHSNGGRELLIETIYENFDIFIDKYVEINFEGFKNVANYLGGIDIYLNNYEEVNELNRVMLLEIAEDPNYSNQKVKNIINKSNLLLNRVDYDVPLIIDNPYITEEDYNYLCDEVGLIEREGKNHLNGRQLLAYSRMRYLARDVSSRTERQKKVIELLIKKLSETSVDKYFGVANEMLKHITTNVPLSEAVGLAAQAMDINNFDIKKMQIPPEHLSYGFCYPGFNNSFVFLMDEENTTKALHEFIFDDIEFDENKYPHFIYENSKYYVEVPDENSYDDSWNDESNPEESENEGYENNENNEKENTDIDTVDNDEQEEIDNSNENFSDKQEKKNLDRNQGDYDIEEDDVNKEESDDITNSDKSYSQDNDEKVDKIDKDNNNDDNNYQETNNENESSEEINTTEEDNSNRKEENSDSINDDNEHIENGNDTSEENESNNQDKEEEGIEIDLE